MDIPRDYSYHPNFNSLNELLTPQNSGTRAVIMFALRPQSLMNTPLLRITNLSLCRAGNPVISQRYWRLKARPELEQCISSDGNTWYLPVSQPYWIQRAFTGCISQLFPSPPFMRSASGLRIPLSFEVFPIIRGNLASRVWFSELNSGRPRFLFLQAKLTDSSSDK